MGTARVEKQVQLNAAGQFLLNSFKNKLSDRDYVRGTATQAGEFSITVDQANHTGMSEGWIYDTFETSLMPQKEIHLAISFHNHAVNVRRNYVIYPQTGVIQEWTVFTNASPKAAKYSFPAMFQQRFSDDVNNLDFHYMTGGGNFTGSQILTPVKLTSDYKRVFDSYEKPEAVSVDGKFHANPANRKTGASVWHQFYALRNRAANDGVFLTFDYMGHWTSHVECSNGNITLNGTAYVSDLEVRPNQTLISPKSMTGVFSGDLDDMGNTILDYVYRYKWDYTKDEYFAKVKANFRFWGATKGPWGSQRESMFDAIDNMRYIGADMFFYGFGWQDATGDWNNVVPENNFKQVNDYVRKQGMIMGMWLPVWNAYYKSRVLLEHPEWRVGEPGPSPGLGTVPFAGYGARLNQALPEVIEWELNVLNSKQREWGPHMWRQDGNPVWSEGNDNDMLAQSENYYGLLKRFRDENPEAGIYGCASGGEAISIEATRYSDAQQSSDGNVLHYDGYWTTLFVPPDKLTSLSNILFNSQRWGKPYETYNRGNLRQSWTVLMYEPNAEMAFEDKEAIRKDIELYHYLKTQNVVGKWVKVYRPTVSQNADPTYFLQKMSQDRTKGYITIRRYDAMKNGTVVIFPKGLDTKRNYTVSFATNTSEATNTGDYWMANGIKLAPMHEGEMVFFNISNRPGMGKDTVAPGAPSNVRKLAASYMSRTGIELNWTAANDNNWVSYYEVFKNGKPIDRVSIGTFYFTLDGTLSDSFEIRTVDGDGNVSGTVQAKS